MTSIYRITTPYSYSAAVIAGDYAYIGLHRGYGDDFSEQLRDTFRNLTDTLQKCGVSLAQVVKVNVWLKHVSDLPEMEKIFVEFFEKDHYPARMTATTEFIDTDCLLMIDGIAYISK